MKSSVFTHAYLCFDLVLTSSSNLLLASSNCVAVFGEGNGGIDGSATKGWAGTAPVTLFLSTELDLDPNPEKKT